MGTETLHHTFYNQNHKKHYVKLNNPLMGTEPPFPSLCCFRYLHRFCVKLNNPLMGTETIQRIQQFQNPVSNLLN